jgi:tetratricopeptide (TPR) repeat protein
MGFLHCHCLVLWSSSCPELFLTCFGLVFSLKIVPDTALILSCPVSVPCQDRAAIMSFVELKGEGNALLKEGRLQEACEKYTAALTFCEDTDRDAAVCLANRSQAWFLQRQPEDALEDAEAATRRDATYAKAFFRKGKALQMLGRDKEANAAFDMASILDQPTSAPPPPVSQPGAKQVVRPPLPKPVAPKKSSHFVEPTADVSDEQKFRLFLSAAQKNNVHVIRYMIEQGMEVSRGNSVPPFDTACQTYDLLTCDSTILYVT